MIVRINGVGFVVLGGEHRALQRVLKLCHVFAVLAMSAFAVQGKNSFDHLLFVHQVLGVASARGRFGS